MKAKIRVHGKSQSRTALGIVNAYLKLYPDSALSDLQQAFPHSLNPKSFTDNIIVPEKEALGHEKQFFEREDEVIVLKNGERLALVELWKKEDYDAICEHAKQFGIEVTGLEGTNPFERGSYELEFLDETVPAAGVATVQEKDGKKKRKFNWWWILFLILLVLILLFCWKCTNPDSAPVENIASEIPATTPTDTVEEEVNPLIRDTGGAIVLTLPDGKEWTIDKNSAEYKLFTFLNSDDAKVDPDKTKGWITLDKLSFETGKAKLAPESDNQLESVANIMKFFSNSHIEMGGHTDNTGSDQINITLSTVRAKAASDKLISFDIDANRVTYAGYGSQYPVCPENNTVQCRAANRRIDVKVTQK